MPLVIRCPHCQKPMQLADNSAGKQFRCPSCQNPFTVGGSQPAPVGGRGRLAEAAPPWPPVPPRRRRRRVRPRRPRRMPAPARPHRPPRRRRMSRLQGGAAAGRHRLHGLRLHDPAGDDRPPRSEGAPNLCPNPACGVANPPGERNCQRCGTVLPTAPGTMLHGRYRIERLLAMGGFGAVYLASDTKDGNRPVAIKDMICADPAGIRHPSELLPPRGRDPPLAGEHPHRAARLRPDRAGPDGPPGAGVHPRPGSAQADGGQQQQAVPARAGHRVGQEHLRRAATHAHAVAAAGPSRSEAGQHHAAGGPPLDQDDRLRHGPRPGPDASRRRWRPRRASIPKVTRRRSRSSANRSRAATCSPWPGRCITWSPARRRRASTPPASWRRS